MPLFLSEEEFRLLSHDAAAVAEKADAAIRDLRRQVDTVRAEADAASIASEQSCALLEQRYETLSAELSRIRSENAQLSSSVEQRLSELAEAQAEKHQLHLKAIAKDGEIDRLSLEVSELNKSKRQILDIVEKKDAEIREMSATIQSYLDKIVNMTDNAVEKESRLQDSEAELARVHALYNRVTQEKDLLEKHNSWLNEELSAKVNSLVELRKTHMDVEADLSSKLAVFERQVNEYTSSLNRSKDRVAELEMRVDFLEKELCSSKDAAAANEEQFAAELSTVTKLAELYKERSEELSKKAGELEGVIKALETHLNQVENENKDKLEKEASVNKKLEKDAAEMKEKLEKCEAEIENSRKANELSLISLPSFHRDSNLEEISAGETHINTTLGRDQMLVPKVPVGISGTALAASLLRDGWSLAKMYEKYQETADALLHEKWGRKNAEAVLERVLHEIEVKAEMILDERAEHERMMEAYTLMNDKLQIALLEHESYETTIRNLKSELKKQERDNTIAQKEILDLEKQVMVLLKECQDIQVRCGAAPRDSSFKSSTDADDGVQANDASSENLMTFKDISELVQQNVQLRSLVHSLSIEDEKKEAVLKETFQVQIQNVTKEATSKVEAVLKRSEEQGRMIESLHSAVALYKRLYEEERKNSSPGYVSNATLPEEEKKELMLLFENSQEVSKKAYEQLAERARNLEEDLSKLRNELTSVRSERDKRSLEAEFARNQLESFMKEVEHQRNEANAVSARNVELTQLLIDFQKKLRECSDSLQASEENSRKLSMEVSILKHEKEILSNSEKRVSDEVCSLSERVHRLQSSLDTIQSTEEVREKSRATERRKHEEYLKQVEREWAEAKKELQEERNRVRSLTLDKEKAVENSMRQVEEMRKELADAWSAVASAESRAAVAEARYSDLEARTKYAEKKAAKGDGRYDHSLSSSLEVPEELWKVKEEMDKLKEEADANKKYMLQYKEIAHTNEVAMRQIESAHEEYKAEAERFKKALESDVSFLRNRVSELEKNYMLKSEEAASATSAKEKELSFLLAENSSLRDEITQKMRQIEALENQVSCLQDDFDREHKRWRIAQDNYERQVILQSETIQELTNTSNELSALQFEISKLREILDTQKTENDILKASWEKEKIALQASMNDAEKKYNEVNEQNKILHSRLESLHIRLADKERSSVGVSSQNSDSQAESDLQNVISHLRRSKEIAETEITLLKLEKSRLQAQLDSALKASETAQALLHSKSENSRAMLFKEEEYKALQLQIREINLLRESNMQLREENKHNFEECQKLREEVQKAKMDAEKFENLSKEKQVEIDASRKEVEILKTEIKHLNIRVLELVECCRKIDPEEYEKMKDELQQNKALLRETQVEVELAKNLASDKQDSISNLEDVLAKCQQELAELEKKLNDSLQVEANIKQENERNKKLVAILKKKNEILTKERDELNKDKQAYMKQIEDTKSSRKATGEMLIDQATKEKDTRIQILEKTLERERDDLRKERDDNRKEKQKRQKTEKALLELNNIVNKDKRGFEEELAKHKQAMVELLKISGLTASQLPPENALFEHFSTYLQSAEKLEAAAGSFGEDGSGHSLPLDTLTTETSMPAAGQQVLSSQMRQSVSHARAIEEREQDSTVDKTKTEVRKTGRKLVRPRLERPEETQVDIEITGTEGPVVVEERAGTSQEQQILGDVLSSHLPSSARKRLASSFTSEKKEDYVAQDEAGPGVAPPLKKSKESDILQEGNEEKIILPSEKTEIVERVLPSNEIPDLEAPLEDMEADQGLALADEDIVDPAEEEENTTIKEEPEEQQKVSLDSVNQDDVHDEGDAITEEFPDKLKMSVDMLDECSRKEGAKEFIHTSVADEDEREEGELMPDESGEQQGGTSRECQRESTPSDATGLGDEAGDALEVASVEIPRGKIDINVAVDVESHDIKDTVAIDSLRSPQRSSGVREDSPSPLLSGVTPQKQSPSTVAETEEPKSGRTISISERAKQGANLRLGRLASQDSQPPPRGRGRSTTYRRGSTRGVSRGGRGGGGRGQA